MEGMDYCHRSLLSAVMAEGTKLFLKCAFFQSRALYLRPDGSRVKNRFRGWSGLLAMVRARRVMAVSFASVRLGVGSCIVLDAKCGILSCSSW